VVERSLTRRDLGDRFVDRRVAHIFRRRTGRDGALCLAARPLSAFRLLAVRAARGALFAIGSALAARRSLVVLAAVARSPDGLWLPVALSIVVAEVQAKLIIRLATAPGCIALLDRLSIVIAEAVAPPVFRFALATTAIRAAVPVAALVLAEVLLPRIVRHPVAARSRRLAVAVAPLIVVVKALPPPIVRFLITARHWRFTVTVAPLIVGAEALPPPIIRLVVLAAPWRLAVPLPTPLQILVARSRLLAMLRLAIKIGGPPRFVVLLVGGLNNGIEPRARPRVLPDGDLSDSTDRPISFSRPSHMRSSMCPLLRADAREQTTRRARFSVLGIECLGLR
jgi:hypothetical protein